MKVDILDVPGKSRKLMLQWLSEDESVIGIQVFEDYIRLIEQIGKSPPDLCVIRLGKDGIPGMKTAEMIQQINTDIKIVFISDEKDHALNAFELGAYGFLLCPLTRAKLDKYLMIQKEM